MTVHRYRTGIVPTWVGPSGVLMVEPGREEIVRRLAGEPLTVDSVIDALVSDGWAAMPDFACIAQHAGGGVSVLVRGAFVVTTAAGEVIDGSGVSTWTERRLHEDDPSMHVEHAEAGGIVLPISDAVVLASSVTLGAFIEPAAENAAPAVVPVVVEPEPEPEPAALVPEPPVVDIGATIAEPDDHVFDAMFGATVPGRRPEDAAVREPVETDLPPVLIDAVPAGDHDGHTMTRQQLAELRARGGPKAAPEASGIVLELTDGQRVEVDRAAVVGRSPRARQTSGAQLPTLVMVDDPYVSGTHVELRVEGRAVMVTDVSTNGTTFRAPDGQAEHLVSQRATSVASGTVLQLSDDLAITVTFEAPA